MYPVSRITSDERAECSERLVGGEGGVWAKGFLTALGTALGRIDEYYICRGLLYAWC